MDAVTDPNILAQLNGGTAPAQPKPVTDPAVLAQLNGQVAGAVPRTSEKIGNALGEGAAKVLVPLHSKDRDAEISKTKDFFGAIGLSVDDMAQAIRQYVPGMDHEAATKAAEDIKARMEKIPALQRYAGDIAATALPLGTAGKLATGAKSLKEMSAVEKVAQALRTGAVGGGSVAALTPVTGGEDIVSGKERQFAEGAGGSMALSGAVGAAKKLFNAARSGDTTAAGIIQKAIDSLGLKPSTLAALSGKADKTVSRAEAVPGIAAAGRAGQSTPEQLGERARAPLTAREAELRAERTRQTEPIRQQALSNGTPIPTNDVNDYLFEQSGRDTEQGRRIYQRVIGELSDNEHGDQIPSYRLENVRNEIKSMIRNGIDGQPIGQTRAIHLNRAVDMLDHNASSAIPAWGQYFDRYRQLSVPLDAFRRQEGGEIGKVIARDNLTGQHDIPAEKVTDHILSGGVTRVRAALSASGNDPAMRKSLGDALWQDLNSKAKNEKLTPASINSFMEKNGDVIKELGLTDRFDMQRGAVKAADAIGKTAVGKLAGAKGNPVDAFDTLGKMLDSSTGRREGLTELANLTKNDPEARQALKYAVVMHGVTQTPGKAALTRQAVLPDLHASGLFSPQDMENVKKINDTYDQVMKIGNSDKTTVGSIVSSIMSHTPGLKTAGRVGKGLMDVGAQTSAEKTRSLLLLAASDPTQAKILLSAPSEKTIREGLSAMERASVYMAMQQGEK